MTGDVLGGHALRESSHSGRRRLDRILAPSYLDGLHALPLDEVRARRTEAEQGEADLSFLRRLVHGRIDIIRAELRSRANGAVSRLIEELSKILADRPSGRPRLKRHLVAGPSRAGEYRRIGEHLLADVELSNVAARSDSELRSALDALMAYEKVLSSDRRAVQQIVDRCRQEIARRYRIGEAQVADLLSRSRR